jgi:hypothetical protein
VLGERNSGLPLPSRVRKPLYETLPDIDRMPGKGRELHGASRILGIFSLPQLPVSDVVCFPTEAMPRKRTARRGPSTLGVPDGRREQWPPPCAN